MAAKTALTSAALALHIRLRRVDGDISRRIIVTDAYIEQPHHVAEPHEVVAVYEVRRYFDRCAVFGNVYFRISYRRF